MIRTAQINSVLPAFLQGNSPPGFSPSGTLFDLFFFSGLNLFPRFKSSFFSLIYFTLSSVIYLKAQIFSEPILLLQLWLCMVDCGIFLPGLIRNLPRTRWVLQNLHI